MIGRKAERIQVPEEEEMQRYCVVGYRKYAPQVAASNRENSSCGDGAMPRDHTI
jgi:hypothetical protein